MLDFAMFNNQHVLIGFYFLLGIPLIGLWGYMFDQVRKNKTSDDSEGCIFSILFAPYITPIAYLLMSVKNRDIKGIIVSAITIGLIVFAFAIGIQAQALDK